MPVSESMTTRYLVKTSVAGIHQKSNKIWISGFGDDAVFEEHVRGWFLHLEGSNEAIFMGDEKPGFSKGDKIRITIERDS